MKAKCTGHAKGEMAIFGKKKKKTFIFYINFIFIIIIII